MKDPYGGLTEDDIIDLSNRLTSAVRQVGLSETQLQEVIAKITNALTSGDEMTFLP